MKNINYVINGVLAVAVVILYIMQFSGKIESSVTRTFASAGDTTALLPIAYVNVDSLLLNYNYMLIPLPVQNPNPESYAQQFALSPAATNWHL